MSDVGASPNKRRTRPHDADGPNSADHEPRSRKRRAFLQTMGQQLREFGPEGTSPRELNRRGFGASPGSNLAAAPSTAALPEGESGPSAQTHTPESDAAPGEDDQVPAGATKSASRWLWRTEEVLPLNPVESAQTYSFEELLDWSQSYFDHWHPAFPFIHAPSLLDYFRKIAQSPSALQNSSSLHHIILRSVLSISLADRRQMGACSGPIPTSLVFHSFNDAINSVQRVLIEETSILSLQALLSVQIFLVSMLRYNAAARLEGLAVRMAFQLNLHRCPAKLGSISAKETELRKRLFWSIFCIDRYICIRLGIPLGIRTEDVDVCYPHEEKHQTLGSDKIGRDDRLDLLEFLARHGNIRGSIMDLRSKVTQSPDSPTDTDQCMRIDAEHTKWWNYVDEYLSMEKHSNIVSKVHQVTLIVLRFESIIALHRSVLASSKKDLAYNAALQRCIFASRSIINTLHKAHKGFGAFDGSPGQRGYESTPLIWPSFTWAVWMSTFIIIFAASEDQVPQDVACRLADRSIEILKHLSLRGTHWPDACMVAIQNLITRLLDRSRSHTRSSSIEPRRHFQPARINDDISARRFLPDRADIHALQYPQRSIPATPRHPPTQAYSHIGTAQALNVSSHQQAINDSSHASESALGPPSTNVDAFTFSNDAQRSATYCEFPPIPSSRLAGSGSFLGIAQQLSDNPIPNEEIMHLFSSDDMSFWMGGDFELGGGM